MTLEQKLRVFTTNEISYRNITILIYQSSFVNIKLDKGYVFEFKHNFKEVTFLNCTLMNNSGNLIDIIPFNITDLN